MKIICERCGKEQLLTDVVGFTLVVPLCQECESKVVCRPIDSSWQYSKPAAKANKYGTVDGYPDFEKARKMIYTEATKAYFFHGPFNSRHEGYAVLLEAMGELWHEIKHGTPEKAHAEAVQVGAMALRFVAEFPGEDGK